jgi:hypothetical protein
MIALRLPKDTCFACPHRARRGNDGWRNIAVTLVDQRSKFDFITMSAPRPEFLALARFLLVFLLACGSLMGQLDALEIHFER